MLLYAKRRNATKDFDVTKHISDKDFDILLSIAQYSPSSFGLEPWHIFVVQNSTVRQELKICSSGAQRQLDSCSHFVIFTVVNELSWYSSYFRHINADIKKLSKKECDEFEIKLKVFQEEKQDLSDQRKRRDWACKQAYIAMSQMIFAATIMGIDSCPIEGFLPDKVNTVLEKNKIICRDYEQVAVMLALGYATKKGYHQKQRREINEIVKFI